MSIYEFEFDKLCSTLLEIIADENNLCANLEAVPMRTTSMPIMPRDMLSTFFREIIKKYYICADMLKELKWYLENTSKITYLEEKREDLYFCYSQFNYIIEIKEQQQVKLAEVFDIPEAEGIFEWVLYYCNSFHSDISKVLINIVESIQEFSYQTKQSIINCVYAAPELMESCNDDKKACDWSKVKFKDNDNIEDLSDILKNQENKPYPLDYAKKRYDF